MINQDQTTLLLHLDFRPGSEGGVELDIYNDDDQTPDQVLASNFLSLALDVIKETTDDLYAEWVEIVEPTTVHLVFMVDGGDNYLHAFDNDEVKIPTRRLTGLLLLALACVNPAHSLVS